MLQVEAIEEILAQHALRHAPEALTHALCPVFSPLHFSIWRIDALLMKHFDIRGPTALACGETELLVHKEVMRATMLAQYARAIQEGGDAAFPSCWCGRASRNTLFSLYAHGYPHAMVARTKTHNHTYVTVPFVTPERSGVLVLDPTAAQCNGGWPLVSIDEKEGATWEHSNGWADNADLYPEKILDIPRCRTLIAMCGKPGEGSLDFGEGVPCDAAAVFTSAFSNPRHGPVVHDLVEAGEKIKNLISEVL